MTELIIPLKKKKEESTEQGPVTIEYLDLRVERQRYAGADLSIGRGYTFGQSAVPVHLLNRAASDDEIASWLEENGVLFVARSHGVELFGRAKLSKGTLYHMVEKARKNNSAAFNMNSSIGKSWDWWSAAHEASFGGRKPYARKRRKTFIVLSFNRKTTLDDAIKPLQAKNIVCFIGLIGAMFFITIPLIIVGAAMSKFMRTESLKEEVEEAAVVIPERKNARFSP